MKRGKTMKRFSKIALSVAAVSAVSAAMAMSAMAMTASYADGTVTLTDVNATGASQTLLVLDTVDLQTVEATNIKQIDQDDTGVSFSSVTVGTLADGTYEVRIGGDGTVQTATFTVGENVTPNTVTLMIGDIDGSSNIDISDVTALARANAGKVSEKYKNTTVGDDYTVSSVTSGTYTADTVKIGDIDGSSNIDISDVTALARANAGKVSDKYKNTTVGAVVEAVPVKSAD
jgi:hypothetical protein